MIVGAFIDVLVFLGAHFAAARMLHAPGVELLSPGSRSGRASLPRRLAVRTAGPLAIYLVAAGLFAAAFSLSGATGTRVTVVLGGPADRAGLLHGDRVTAVDGDRTTTFAEVRERVLAAARGATVTISVDRDGVRRRFVVAPDPEGRVGLQSSEEVVDVPLGDSVARGLTQPFVVLATWTGTVARGLSGRIEPGEAVGPVADVAAAREAPSPRQRMAPVLAMFGYLCAVPWPMFLLYAVVTTTISELRSRRRAGDG